MEYVTDGNVLQAKMASINEGYKPFYIYIYDMIITGNFGILENFISRMLLKGYMK